ncbi:nitric oxide synthase oxygenase [Kitasatospora sp. NPDC093102]|uniref:nitric oxide synthase oxygenase n=1 Tax=Kitasatospora sp. NPDC093102 TaxID=3155069 RepID=UPI003423A041
MTVSVEATVTALSQPPTKAVGPATETDRDELALADQAFDFVRQFHTEQPGAGDPAQRIREVLAEIRETGTYRHTAEELAYGAKLAWRNAARCIGRLYWNSLVVRDFRHVTDPAGMAEQCVEHLRIATNGGKIRPVITVFAPDAPGRPAPRLLNQQLVRYAGYPREDGGCTGDPAGLELAARARAAGWTGGQGRFDVLPLMIQQSPADAPHWYQVPEDVVMEVPLVHPDHAWFADLGLRWYAVPAISDMMLEIGGISYPAAPFNGWYMGTEIGARNLVDAERYDMLGEVAARLGLDTSSPRTMWRDRAMIEINIAVLHSFDAAGVTMADHHTESDRFLRHIAKEMRQGRETPADWSWIVPPVSGSLTPVYHRYYDQVDPNTRPAFLLREPW